MYIIWLQKRHCTSTMWSASSTWNVTGYSKQKVIRVQLNENIFKSHSFFFGKDKSYLFVTHFRWNRIQRIEKFNIWYLVFLQASGFDRVNLGLLRDVRRPYHQRKSLSDFLSWQVKVPLEKAMLSWGLTSAPSLLKQKYVTLEEHYIPTFLSISPFGSVIS